MRMQLQLDKTYCCRCRCNVSSHNGHAHITKSCIEIKRETVPSIATTRQFSLVRLIKILKMYPYIITDVTYNWIT